MGRKKHFALQTSLLLGFVLLFAVSLSAQDTTAYSRVYFMRKPTAVVREGLLERALNYFNVFIDTSFVCSLNEQKYSIHNVVAGRHNFGVQFRGRNQKVHSHKISMNIETGKSYYIALEFYGEDARNPLICHPLNEDLAELILPSLKQDKSCNPKK